MVVSRTFCAPHPLQDAPAPTSRVSLPGKVLYMMQFAADGTSLYLSPVHTTNTGAIKSPCESPEQPESSSSGFTGSPELREERNVLHRKAPDTIPLSEGNDLTTLPEFVRRHDVVGNSLQRDSSPWDGIMDVVNNFNHFCAPSSFNDKKTELVHALVHEIVITGDRLIEGQGGFVRSRSLPGNGKSQDGTRVEQSAAKGKGEGQGASSNFLKAGVPTEGNDVQGSWEWHKQQAVLKNLKPKDQKECMHRGQDDIARRQGHEQNGDALLRVMKLQFSSGNFEAAQQANEKCVEEYTEAFERSPERFERIMKVLKRFSVLIYQARVKEIQQRKELGLESLTQSKTKGWVQRSHSLS